MTQTQILNEIIKMVLKVSTEATEGPWSTTPCAGEGWQHHSLVNGYQRAVKHRDFIKTADAELIAQYRALCPAIAKTLSDCIAVLERSKIAQGDMEWLEQKIEENFRK